MTRIATNAANMASLSALLRNQSDMVTAQTQVSTGKKADDLKGQASYVGMLNSMRAVLARSQGALDRITRLEPQLDIQATALAQVSSGGDSLKQNLLDALSMDDGNNLMDQVKSAFDSVKNALNQKYDGNYLFAGVTSSRQPFTANSLDDVGAAANVSDLFNNANQKTVSRVDDGQPFETGFLADDVGSTLMQVFKNIKDYNDGPNGPFGANLTTDQQTFLRSQIQTLAGVTDHLRNEEAKNGLVQNKVDAAKTAQQDQQTTMTSIVGNLEDVDMAKAASDLQNAQTAVQVSAKAFTVLSSTSLLNYLS